MPLKYYECVYTEAGDFMLVLGIVLPRKMIQPFEKTGEVVKAMEVMTSQGMPPHMVKERILEIFFPEGQAEENSETEKKMDQIFKTLTHVHEVEEESSDESFCLLRAQSPLESAQTPWSSPVQQVEELPSKEDPEVCALTEVINKNRINKANAELSEEKSQPPQSQGNNSPDPAIIQGGNEQVTNDVPSAIVDGKQSEVDGVPKLGKENNTQPTKPTQTGNQKDDGETQNRLNLQNGPGCDVHKNEGFLAKPPSSVELQKEVMSSTAPTKVKVGSPADEKPSTPVSGKTAKPTSVTKITTNCTKTNITRPSSSGNNTTSSAPKTTSTPPNSGKETTASSGQKTNSEGGTTKISSSGKDSTTSEPKTAADCTTTNTPRPSSPGKNTPAKIAVKRAGTPPIPITGDSKKVEPTQPEKKLMVNMNGNVSEKPVKTTGAKEPISKRDGIKNNSEKKITKPRGPTKTSVFQKTPPKESSLAGGECKAVTNFEQESLAEINTQMRGVQGDGAPARNSRQVNWHYHDNDWKKNRLMLLAGGISAVVIGFYVFFRSKK